MLKWVQLCEEWWKTKEFQAKQQIISIFQAISLDIDVFSCKSRNFNKNRFSLRSAHFAFGAQIFSKSWSNNFSKSCGWAHEGAARAPIRCKRARSARRTGRSIKAGLRQFSSKSRSQPRPPDHNHMRADSTKTTKIRLVGPYVDKIATHSNRVGFDPFSWRKFPDFSNWPS